MSVDARILATMREEEKLEEARRIIRNQASTAPENGDLSAIGSITRATGLRDSAGRPIYEAALAAFGRA